MAVSPDPELELQVRLKYQFKDPGILHRALTHASVAPTRSDSNERMEFLGDAVLGLVVCHELYDRLPNAPEGELTKIKSAVVSREACARIADTLALAEALRLGQGIDREAVLPRSLLAAAFEAIVAAIYLDGGIKAARRFLMRALKQEMGEARDTPHHNNYKSQLQQSAQRMFNASPRYELLDEKGPDHAKCFEVAVSIRNQQFPAAWGPTKKTAEQRAALYALAELGEVELQEDDQ